MAVAGASVAMVVLIYVAFTVPVVAMGVAVAMAEAVDTRETDFGTAIRAWGRDLSRQQQHRNIYIKLNVVF